MTSRSQTVFSRTVLTTGGMAVQGVARLLYTLAIGRIAGQHALADASTLLSLAVWLSLVLPAGLGVASSRYLPNPESAGSAATQLGRWFWASSLTLSVVSAPLAYSIVHDLASALSCAVLVWSYSAYVYTRGALMGEDRILRSALADLASSLIAITALFVVLAANAHWALLLPLALGYAVFASVSRPKTPREAVTPSERSAMLKYVRAATLSGLATGGLLPATMVFVRAFDAPMAGLFAAALSLATPASLLSQSINQVLIPHFARMQHDVRAMRVSQLKLLAATSAIFAFVFGALILLSPWILATFYGKTYAGGAGAMQGLLLVIFLISSTCAPSAYLMAANRQRLFAGIWLLGFISGTITMAIAAPLWGTWGALLGFAVGGGGGSLAVIGAGALLTPGSTSISPSSNDQNRVS